MGCKGLCTHWPSVRIGPKRAWYDAGLKYCTTCDKKIDPNGVVRRVGAVFFIETHRQIKTTSGMTAKSNKCPCCHNTMRGSPVESKDLDSRKNKIYGEVPRLEAEVLVV